MSGSKLFVAFGGAITFLLLASCAHEPPPKAQIGWLSRGSKDAPDGNMNAFRLGMKELGYIEGQSFEIVPRYANGKPETIPGQAQELEQLGVDLIVAGPFEALVAANSNTRQVPIIMTPSTDPVMAGLITKLERPGGRITGITEMMPQLMPQRLNLLHDLVPTIRHVAILRKPGTLNDEVFSAALKATKTTASSLGIELQVFEAADSKEVEVAFSAMEKVHIDGLIVMVNATYVVQSKVLLDNEAKQKLPTIYEWTTFTRNGGLISYGADVGDVYRRAAGVADKILRGANPATLPVQSAEKIELGINLKTAKALNIEVPAEIRKRATVIIE